MSHSENMVAAVWILFLLHGYSIKGAEAHSIHNRDTHKDTSYDLETSKQRDYVLRGSVPPLVPPVTSLVPIASPSTAADMFDDLYRTNMAADMQEGSLHQKNTEPDMSGSLYGKNSVAGMLGDLYRKKMEANMPSASYQMNAAADMPSNLYSRNIVAGMLGDLYKEKTETKMPGTLYQKNMARDVQRDMYRRHVAADTPSETFSKMFSHFTYGHFPGSFPTKIPRGGNGRKGDDIMAGNDMRNYHKPDETSPSSGITDADITNRITQILDNYDRLSSDFSPDHAQKTDNPVNDSDMFNDDQISSSDRAKSYIGTVLQRSKRHPELVEELDKPRRNKLPAHIYRLVMKEWLRHRAQKLIDGNDANRKLLTPGSREGLSVGLDIRALKLVADDRARQLRQEKLRESQDKLGLIG